MPRIGWLIPVPMGLPAAKTYLSRESLDSLSNTNPRAVVMGAAAGLAASIRATSAAHSSARSTSGTVNIIASTL